MPLSRPFPGLLLVAALALAACEDAPTAPGAQVQSAGGKLWVAVPAPRALPESRTWLPYLAGSDSAALRVAKLRDQARRLRWKGEPEEAIRREGEASRLAAASLSAAPDARTLAEAVAAVDGWLGAAERAAAAVDSPELAAGVAGVREARGAVAARLEAGDTLGAVPHLDRAAALAREHTPGAVALRLVDRAEALVDARALSRADAARARHLLRHAREALITGDPNRAFRRAAYALQILSAATRHPSP